MKNRSIFNVCPDAEFFGRVKEIEYISCRAKAADTRMPSIILKGRRWTGKTEILRRVHRNLFWGSAHAAPVYYQFKGYGSAEVFAEDYLKEVVKQYIAFRRRESDFARAEVSLDRIERMLSDDDPFGLIGFIERHREAKASGDNTAVLRNALSSPYLIGQNSGIPVFPILDDIDLAGGVTLYKDGPGIMKEFDEAAASFPILLSSAGRSGIHGLLTGHSETIELAGLPEDVAVSMMMELCRQHNLEFDAEILSLGARRLEGSPMYIKNLVWAAKRACVNLTGLRDLAELYVFEITSGTTGFAIGNNLRLSGLNDLRILNACMHAPVGAEELQGRFKMGPGESKKAVEELASMGLIEANLGSVRWAGDNVARDFIQYICETRVKGRSAEEARTHLVRAILKEGFSLKSEKIKVRPGEEVLKVLRSFAGQRVQKALMNSRIFALKQKNGSVAKGEEEVTLPHVVGCFDTSSREKGETGPRLIIANGFQDLRFDSASEVVWIVCVKEAPSTVNLGDVENFLRRSALLREDFRGSKIARWMVGVEGFSAEALKRLETEGVYSTNGAQLGILKGGVEDKSGHAREASQTRLLPTKEFEVVLPASTKAELVAAKAVEEIGTEMGFDEDSIGRIKAAVIEACINAFEHSRLKSGRIHLRFIAYEDRLVVHVENSGIDFAGPAEHTAEAEAGGLPRKRGWGIELMKGLMDEVRFERLKDGTRITLVKYLTGKGGKGDDKETEKL